MNLITELPTVALSVRQPWAWLIVNGHKDIENRSRNIANFTGPVLIHASERMTRADYEACLIFVSAFNADLAEQIPDLGELHRGGIVGMAEITGHGNMEMKSPWWTGPYSYMIEDARTLPFQECPGRLGFFPCIYNVTGSPASSPASASVLSVPSVVNPGGSR